ncbi:CoA transferase [Actinomadura sp. NBRC 104412]|uniref:CoA transferase n=1 Tax=Actinomadura sp. NBRC 104412 TaxID=3032203 RepID=UPI002553F3DF|nr:CoA transferase [Actinomadura sp. NBRC 104412]
MILLDAAWRALGGEPGLLGTIERSGPAATLPSRLDVTGMAMACAGAAGVAAAELERARGGALPRVLLDSRAVAVAFAGERHLRIDGMPQNSFGPLSRFWKAADGWVRTHGNYRHHRRRLFKSLGVESLNNPVPALESIIRDTRAEEIEETVFAAGGVAVAARTAEQWDAHPQGAAVAGRPLVTSIPTGRGGRQREAAPAAFPMDGVRVLDLTRVIAGPVGTRTLAYFGAEVLRIDSPAHAEFPVYHVVTGSGKRSTFLDFNDSVDRSRLRELLRDTDVVVLGYRPGALDRYGLAPEALVDEYPGLVVASLSAWGGEGPWARRRGFDSLVQAASGIAFVEGRPGVLPVQALDHGTGYLLAAAVMRALTEGGGCRIELSLARTAAWLLAHPGDGTATDFDPAPYLDEVGGVRYALPAVRFEGGPRTWRRPASIWGSDEPRWP